jgi:hypothetical protein
MLNFNYDLIYNPVFIWSFIVSLLVFICIFSILYYKYVYNTTINFEILPVTPKKPIIVTYYNHSLIDKYPVNTYKFPEFKHASQHKVKLSAGDSIFIPAGWWHWVFSEGDCIAFSHIIHNYNENIIKEKQSHNYKDKTIKYYINNANNIDFAKYSDESTPLVYNSNNLNFLTESVLENSVDKTNLLVSKTNTIVTSNKPENTTITLINGTFKDFLILNKSNKYYSYIGMSPLDKNTFNKYINNEWTNFANSKNSKNDIYLWYSKKKIDTGLHYDITDNLLTLHSGKKTILLFPPSETKYLYNELLNNIKNYGYFHIRGDPLRDLRGSSP